MSGNAKLSRNEKLHLWRGRRPAHQRPAICRACRNPPRERNESKPVLPWTSRQIYMGGHWVELLAIGHPGGLSLCAVGRTRADSGQAEARVGALLCPVRELGPAARYSPSSNTTRL